MTVAGRCCNCSSLILRSPGKEWPWACPTCGVRGVCIDYLPLADRVWAPETVKAA